MNAANEIAVDAFLRGQIRFTDIERINRQIVEQFPFFEIKQIDDVFEVDQKARESARRLILAF